MAAFVLDTSIALKWFLEDESDRAYSLAILKAITDNYRPAVPRAHNLTSYDAAFLELAMRLQLPLATSDQALVRAAAGANVPLLKF